MSTSTFSIQAFVTRHCAWRSRYDYGGVSTRWFLPSVSLESDHLRRFHCLCHYRYDRGDVKNIFGIRIFGSIGFII
jgi:hypothetical protein